MKTKKLGKGRLFILIGVLFVIMVAFTLRLANIQIVNAEKYKSRSATVYTRTQRVRAARGEIYDRNGVPLAVNSVGYDLVINKAYFDTDVQNDTIIRLAQILSDAGEEWNDELPLSKTAPFGFPEDSDKETEKLKAYLNIAKYTTADDTVYWLRKNYGLEDASDEIFRIVAGVRYTMYLHGFSMKVPYTFASDISMDTVTKISENSRLLPGAVVEETTVRNYVAGDVAPHIVGIIGPIYAEDLDGLDESYSLDDKLGKSGVEKAFEATLRGTNGETTVYLDSATGNVVGVEETVLPKPGMTLFLTIDVNMQRALQDALKIHINHLRKQEDADHGKDANAGAAVVIDVKTGEVLASANYPTFDLSTYYEDYSELIKNEDRPYYDRAFRGIYAPGSTYKPNISVAALTEGVITASTKINCTGKYEFYADYQPTCMGRHKEINVVNALRVSCNIFFYDVGRQLGIDRINQYATLFGLGEPTGVEIPESLGRRASLELRKTLGQKWFPGDTLQAAIGQSDNAFSPLQIANYTATLANSGKRMDVNLIKKITSYNGDEITYEAEPTVLVDFSEHGVPQSAFDTVREGMILATAGTAGDALKNYPITLATKTGTPETGVFLNSVFICYAPADDPEIAIAVALENAGHGYNASQIVRYFLDYYFYGIEPSVAARAAGIEVPE